MSPYNTAAILTQKYKRPPPPELQTTAVGKALGHGPSRTMVYTGPIKGLRGKRAIVMDEQHSDTTVVAQFNDVTTGRGYGWWSFPAEHWRKP